MDYMEAPPMTDSECEELVEREQSQLDESMLGTVVYLAPPPVELTRLEVWGGMIVEVQGDRVVGARFTPSLQEF